METPAEYRVKTDEQIILQLSVLEEHGYESAMLGMSLSWYDRSIPLNDWWDEEKLSKAHNVAKKLAFKGGGHNKFLESIQVWLLITATRAFWSEFDTYRVGMTKQSSSTMHTLSKRLVKASDFAKGTELEAIAKFNNLLETNPDISQLKYNLPEGWLQERVVCTNYKVLQNIYNQRYKHKLQDWRIFCNKLLCKLNHSYFIYKSYE